MAMLFDDAFVFEESKDEFTASYRRTGAELDDLG